MVIMPKPTIRQVVKNPDWLELYSLGEPSETRSFKVFGQENRLIHLKFFPAANQFLETTDIKFIEGNKLVAKNESGSLNIILSVYELGSLAPEAFLTTYIGEDIFSNSRCILDETEPNIWYLNVIPINVRGIKAYNEGIGKWKICGPHSNDWHALPTTFFIKDGIVVVVESAHEFYGLDISSIIYESRG